MEDLYLDFILILIFVHLEERGTPSVPLAETTCLKLSTEIKKKTEEEKEIPGK